MGAIIITIHGSFKETTASYDAEDGGHAMAIQRAIQFLNSVLKDAIVKDHRLHDAGEQPSKADFGRSQDMGGVHP